MIGAQPMLLGLPDIIWPGVHLLILCIFANDAVGAKAVATAATVAARTSFLIMFRNPVSGPRFRPSRASHGAGSRRKPSGYFRGKESRKCDYFAPQCRTDAAAR